VKMRLCLLLSLIVRVRLSLFESLEVLVKMRIEDVPVAVPECEGEAVPL
jgi:hypothetical protein